MDDEAPSEVLFRASKRRKFLRKPARSDVDRGEALNAEDAITEPSMKAGADNASGVVLAKRKGGSGRTGISFSSDTRRIPSTEQDEDQALVIAEESGALQIPGNDRFVRPTGRVGPTEDRHMMAYVDSKLAEPRLATELPAHSNGQNTSNSADEGIAEPTNDETLIKSSTSAELPQNAASTAARTYQRAQVRSARTYQRPTKRRAPPARKEEDVARDSMIEQIMGEGQVPHYEYQSGGMEENMADDMNDVDHDAAAADAFKAQLLADLEQNNRRRRPATKANATASTGPKLGGSRSQREKMKALEEAKGKK